MFNVLLGDTKASFLPRTKGVVNDGVSLVISQAGKGRKPFDCWVVPFSHREDDVSRSTTET